MTSPDAEQTITSAETTILDAIRVLLERRGEPDLPVTPGSRFAEDLDFDSLELAELSAALEDELGRDPFTEGILPETVSELLAYYDG